LRIATWNVEYADSAATNARRRGVMHENPADIWVLTETHDDLVPGEGFNAVHAAQRPIYGQRVKPGSRWVSIWSRFPLTPVRIDGSDNERTVVAKVETPMGSLTVYGAVMPWCGDKGRMGERVDASGWSEFHRVVPQQIKEWRQLVAADPDTALCVAGDYNVDLGTGAHYGSQETIALVRQGLDQCGLFCATEPSRMPRGALSNPPIDHIALPLAWARRTNVVAAWEGRTGQPRLSDHSGLIAEIF
jgi:hypothetical protein